MMTNHNFRPNHALDQKVADNRHPFCSNKIGIWFLQQFYPKHGLASNHNPSLHEYFMRTFLWFWPLKIKISEKNYVVLTLSGCLTTLAFKMSQSIMFAQYHQIISNSVSVCHFVCWLISASQECYDHICFFRYFDFKGPT